MPPNPHHPPAAPHRGWLTANLVAQFAFTLVAMTICLPSMQEWPRIFGASQAAVQLTFSGFVAANGAFQLLYGPLSDRLGRKPVLMAGLVLAFAGSLLAALATDLTLLTLSRVLQGAGCAAPMVIGRALIQDFFEGTERTRTMAFVGMVMGVCPPLATLIGGQVHVRLGWAFNFWILAALALGLLVWAWRGLPEPARKPLAAGAVRPNLVSGYARLSREPSFVLHVIVLGTTAATFYTFLGGAPLVLAGYGVTPERMGWYIMTPPLAYVLGNMLTTRLVRRMGEGQIMVAGQLITLGGVALVLALSVGGWHNALALSLPLVLLGIGHGLLVPPTLTGTVGLIPALAGSAAAVAGLMQQLNGAIGGYLVGLVPHRDAANLALMMLGWCVLGLAALLLLRRNRQRAARTA